MSENIPTVALTIKGGNKELKVEKNKEFNVALQGNPTTGYSWYMSNVDEVKNSNAIEILNLNKYNGADDYVHDPHEPGMAGFGGTYYFKFKVKEANGDLPKLLFVYKRAWENNAESNAEITLKF